MLIMFVMVQIKTIQQVHQSLLVRSYIHEIIAILKDLRVNRW